MIKVGDTITHQNLNIHERVIFINKEYIVTEWNYVLSIINKFHISKSINNLVYQCEHSRLVLNKFKGYIYIYD